MADIWAEFTADALSILNEIGKDVQIKAVPGGTPVTFKAQVTAPMVLQDMETGGFLNQTTFEVKILRTHASAHPGLFAFGNIVIYDGQEYRIVALANRPPSAWLVAKVQTKVQ
jgi:hypothetical protein